MNVGAVGAVGSGAAPVYAALSPYLNGVVRTSDAAAAATLAATAASAGAAATAAAVAARGAAAEAVTAAPPFANPAITDIAQRVALGQALPQPAAITQNAVLGPAPVSATAPPPATATGTALAIAATRGTSLLATPTPPPPQQPSPTESVLYGDSGLLIQSYGAVALVAGVQAVPPILVQAAAPVIPAPAPVAAIPRLAKVT